MKVDVVDEVRMEAVEDEEWKVTCEDDFTCTDLTNQPGASVISPVVLCLSGVVGECNASR